ncbi:MAG: sulfite exporter TauE/SafE family protein [Lachnospiraceae bacterium]|nr:sulfite exporter TauE/SafE family protein [Lachnospiraceae bacterium]
MLIWIVATLVAFFIKGLCGFANALVFNSILTFGNNNINVSPVELLVGYPTNIILAYRERKHLKKSIVIPLSILVLAGSIPGVFLLKNTDVTIIKVIFGIVVILIGIEMFFRERAKKRESSKAVLLVIGVLSGLLCGLYGIGALLGAYVSRVSENTKEFKGNICFVFTVENTFRIALYALTGIITFDVLKRVVFLVPFMLIGLFLGIKCANVLDDKVVKKLVIVLLILSGVVLVISNLS